MSSTKKRLLCLAQSLFLLWHTLALLAGAAPSSYSMGKAFPIFRPYLVLIGLPGMWSFFAPEPGPSTVLRYAVHDASGGTHLFKWGETLSRKDPNFFRWTSLHGRIFLEKENYERTVALSLCRKHRSLNPKSVNFIFVRLLKLSPKAYLAGARPLDPEYVEPEEGETIACPG